MGLFRLARAYAPLDIINFCLETGFYQKWEYGISPIFIEAIYIWSYYFFGLFGLACNKNGSLVLYETPLTQLGDCCCIYYVNVAHNT